MDTRSDIYIYLYCFPFTYPREAISVSDVHAGRTIRLKIKSSQNPAKLYAASILPHGRGLFDFGAPLVPWQYFLG